MGRGRGHSCRDSATLNFTVHFNASRSQNLSVEYTPDAVHLGQRAARVVTVSPTFTRTGITTSQPCRAAFAPALASWAHLGANRRPRGRRSTPLRQPRARPRWQRTHQPRRNIRRISWPFWQPPPPTLRACACATCRPGCTPRPRTWAWPACACGCCAVGVPLRGGTTTEHG